MGEAEDKGFVIKDRRIFSKDRTEETDKVEPEEPKKAQENQKEETSKEIPKEQKGDSSAHIPLPEVTFSTFIFSLASSAMVHLGEVVDPHTNTKKVDLPMAKQTIDILGMLKEKTKGNLENEEERLLDNLLFELRMKYVAKSK